MRIYFDENFSPSLIAGMRAFQAGRKSEEVEVCSVEEEFGKGAKDEDWLPRVARQHGVVVTQDINIHRARAQWELCQKNRIGIIFLKPPKKGWSYWEIVQLVVRWWGEIKALARNETRPFGRVIEIGKSRIAEI